jgi:hypothetical protein
VGAGMSALLARCDHCEGIHPATPVQWKREQGQLYRVSCPHWFTEVVTDAYLVPAGWVK